eukprot:5415210-Prymnesium_polylepis.2
MNRPRRDALRCDEGGRLVQHQVVKCGRNHVISILRAHSKLVSLCSRPVALCCALRGCLDLAASFLESRCRRSCCSRWAAARSGLLRCNTWGRAA